MDAGNDQDPDFGVAGPGVQDPTAHLAFTPGDEPVESDRLVTRATSTGALRSPEGSPVRNEVEAEPISQVNRESFDLTPISPVTSEQFNTLPGQPSRGQPSVREPAGAGAPYAGAPYAGTSETIAPVPDATGELGEAPSRTTQPSPVVTTSPPRAPLGDAPAGRSWMESLGSHGVVIVLLLVVVAAALLTGQGEEDPSTQSLTTQSELLDFDDLNVDLPLPAANTGTAIVESKPAAPVESHLHSSTDVTSFPVQEPVVQVNPTPHVDVSPAISSPAISEDEASISPPTDPIASLEAPLPVKVDGFDHELNDGLLSSSGVQANRFVSPESGVDAVTVGNRGESRETDSSLPSLEELANLQQQASEAVEVTAPKPVSNARLLTETPVGISDWSKYLPPLSSAVEPDAGISSSSNQVLQP